jgi:hypothetical protein
MNNTVPAESPPRIMLATSTPWITLCFASGRHCEERSDEAISIRGTRLLFGVLRTPRNGGNGRHFFGLHGPICSSLHLSFT